MISAIKNKIKDKLDALKVAGTLGLVIMDDLKVGILDRDFSAFPVAVIQPASIEGTYFTNRQNSRKHNVQIVVIQKVENITGSSDIETLAETLIDAFDNDPTLGDTASGGVEPSSTVPEAVTSKGKSMIAFSILIKAKAIKDLTFS
ncbi:MAG: hypothetical protein M3P98_01555 [bacterium]|nr:hypothetical protein [bacterium]